MLSLLRWGKNHEGGCPGIQKFVFPSHSYIWWSTAFLMMVEHLPMESGEWISHFVLPAHVVFALLTKLSLSQLTSFLTCILSVLSPVPLRGVRVSGHVGLSCWLESNHDNIWLSKEDNDWEGKQKKNREILWHHILHTDEWNTPAYKYYMQSVFKTCPVTVKVIYFLITEGQPDSYFKDLIFQDSIFPKIWCLFSLSINGSQRWHTFYTFWETNLFPLHLRPSYHLTAT